MTSKGCCIIAALLTGLAACAPASPPRPPIPEPPAASGDSAPLQWGTLNRLYPNDGSIPMSQGYIGTVVDPKAYRVGDTITVNIIESIVSQSQATTNLSTDHSISAGIPALFGLESLAQGSILNAQNLVDAKAKLDDQGSGTMTSNDTVTATVTAVVTKVLPSGLLEIQGSRAIRLNGEDDVLSVKGYVRPQDINSFNTVNSNQIANLDVSFAGHGWVRDRQGGGWGSKILSWLWPF